MTQKRLIYIESVVLVSLVLLFTGATYQRNFAWKDNLSLWSDVVKKSPGKARAHDYMGIAKYKSRLINDAVKHHQLAINIDPAYPYPYVNLGICYFDKGNVDSAITQFKHAIQLSPRNADAHYNLGIAYGSKGLYDMAFKEMRIARMLGSGQQWKKLVKGIKGTMPSIPGHP
ncbi:MAG: tetratricopeptide repeat protein [Desulfobacteraceae bacterium]|nr:tetratricopeptide repeat protein [Desulfobacteraceae bacterium]MBC2720291.1 tetratricopeptide repeat protein [Desulfobacteraceae bacterium]